MSARKPDALALVSPFVIGWYIRSRASLFVSHACGTKRRLWDSIHAQRQLRIEALLLFHGLNPLSFIHCEYKIKLEDKKMGGNTMIGRLLIGDPYGYLSAEHGCV